jgi:DNA polymerase III sliding clamp (beta) subunit (PCNA family)
MKIEIEFSASDLKQAVAGLGKVMSRSGLPALRCARLIRDDSGNVSFSVTDLDSLATYRLRDPQDGPTGDMLVPWELLAKAARNTKDRAVFIREKADTVVARTFIGSMSFEEPAAMPPLDEWPFIPPVTGPWLDLNATFKTAFIEAMSCSSTDSSRFVINGVCLDLTKPDAHYVVGTNGRQLYAANTFKFDLPRSIIVPNRKFLAWTGFAEDGEWKARTNLEQDETAGGWIEISSDRWSMRTKLIAGEYPNWRPVFPAEESSATTVRLTPEAIKMLLEVVPMVRTADRSKEFACIAVHGESLVLHSRSEASESWKDIAVPGASAAGPAATVLVHREQFTHALRMGFDQIELRDPLSPTVLRAPGKQIVLGCIRGDMPQTTSTEESSPSTPQPEKTTTEKENNERNSVNTITKGERPKAAMTAAQNESDSALRAAALQVENVRNNFREGLNGLNQALNFLKAAEKEQKSSEKEIESVRTTLRSLQRVQI